MKARTIPKFSKRGGFTLFEIIVVVIILGVFAGMAVAGYKKFYEGGVCRRMINDLVSISAAQNIYMAQHGRYWGQAGDCASGCRTMNINEVLKLQLSARDGIEYFSCSSTDSTHFTCSAIGSLSNITNGSLGAVHEGQIQQRSATLTPNPLAYPVTCPAEYR